MMRNYYIFIFFLATYGRTILACECPLKHLQTISCEVDAILNVDVINSTEEGNWIVYNVMKRMATKISKEALVALGLHTTLQKIYTYKTAEECGAKLNDSTTYSIFARVIDNKLVTTTCDGQFDYNTLLISAFETTFLAAANFFCHCKVIPCFGTNCPSDENSCVWNIFEGYPIGIVSSCQKEKIDLPCQWVHKTQPLHNLEYKFQLPQRYNTVPPDNDSS